MNTYKPRKKELKRYKPRYDYGRGVLEKRFTPQYKLACEIRGSDQWKRVRRKSMSLASGMCLYCYKKQAEEVHHIKGLKDFPDLAFDLDNLCPLCIQCHGWMETRNLREDDTEKQIRDRMERNINVRSLEELV